MRHDMQVQLLKRMLHCAETGETASAGEVRRNPASVYLDDDLLAREKTEFFLNEPLVACLTADIPEPGSFSAQTLLGTPVLIVRGRDNQVRAFLNACPHRGTKVESESCGKRRLFTCPFHGWSFAEDGRAVAIPKAEHFGLCPETAPSLTELPCAEKYGIVWVRLRQGAPIDPDAQLGELAGEIESWRLSESKMIDTACLEANINWKLAVDTFGETYHFAALHQNTVNGIYHSNLQLYDTYGRNHRMCFVARTVDELRSVPEYQWRVRPHTLIAYYLFPNTQLLVHGGGVQLYRIFPSDDAVGKSETYFSYYAEEAELASTGIDEARGVFELSKLVIAQEDYATAETAQSGLASGLQKEMIFGINEPALHHYHQNYRRELGLPPLETLAP
jgi:phenylpropionate dioxygenase-like ring-hydroxylating dioxygenase large terminal subunit